MSMCGGWETANSTARAMSSAVSVSSRSWLKPARLDHARGDQRGPDAGAVEILPGGLGHAGDGELGRAVEAPFSARRPAMLLVITRWPLVARSAAAVARIVA